MLRRALSIFCLSSIFSAGVSHAQTEQTGNDTPEALTLGSPQVSESDVIQTIANKDDLNSINSTAAESFEPAPFLDAYELGFIEDNEGVRKQEFTQDELAKIKESFNVPKSKDDPRYKPVFNIRAGEEKPEWQKDDYYPAGR